MATYLGENVKSCMFWRRARSKQTMQNSRKTHELEAWMGSPLNTGDLLKDFTRKTWVHSSNSHPYIVRWWPHFYPSMRGNVLFEGKEVIYSAQNPAATGVAEGSSEGHSQARRLSENLTYGDTSTIAIKIERHRGCKISLRNLANVKN